MSTSSAAHKIPPAAEEPARPKPAPRPARRVRRAKVATPDPIKRARARARRFVRDLGRSWRLRLLKWALLLTAPVWLINVAVAGFGHSVVFPLSPFFLREKVAALGKYALHRPLCWLGEHPDTAPLVARAEIRYRLPRGLLAGIIQVESGGKPHRISSAGAMGVGQLMPDTARRLGVGDPFDTVDNVDGAARLMAQHLAHFHNVRLAIAAYHAGPSAVRHGVPQNGMTPDYVARVMRAYAASSPRRARVTLER
jgi:soluble lytic murein transglycosylase-like protein